MLVFAVVAGKRIQVAVLIFLEASCSFLLAAGLEIFGYYESPILPPEQRQAELPELEREFFPGRLQPPPQIRIEEA